MGGSLLIGEQAPDPAGQGRRARRGGIRGAAQGRRSAGGFRRGEGQFGPSFKSRPTLQYNSSSAQRGKVLEKVPLKLGGTLRITLIRSYFILFFGKN